MLEAVITDEEKRRIEGLDLANDPEVAPRPWFKSAGVGTRMWRLRHRPDGGCVFLTAGNRCRLHERFGAEVKPFVCRLFPFILIPAGNHWRVGLRFACPSVAADRGSPVTESEKDLIQLSGLLERHVGRSADSAPAPSLQAGEQLPWPDLCRLVQVLVEIVQDRSDRLERRLRKCRGLARLCSKTRLDALQGTTLS
jgi:lysine-N-methylase